MCVTSHTKKVVLTVNRSQELVVSYDHCSGKQTHTQKLLKPKLFSSTDIHRSRFPVSRRHQQNERDVFLSVLVQETSC